MSERRGKTWWVPYYPGSILGQCRRNCHHHLDQLTCECCCFLDKETLNVGLLPGLGLARDASDNTFGKISLDYPMKACLSQGATNVPKPTRTELWQDRVVHLRVLHVLEESRGQVSSGDSLSSSSLSLDPPQTNLRRASAPRTGDSIRIYNGRLIGVSLMLHDEVNSWNARDGSFKNPGNDRSARPVTL